MRSYKAEWRKNRQSPLAHGNETQSSISSCFYSSTQKRSNIAKDRPHGVDQKFVPILRVCVRDRATRSEFRLEPAVSFFLGNLSLVGSQCTEGNSQVPLKP